VATYLKFKWLLLKFKRNTLKAADVCLQNALINIITLFIYVTLTDPFHWGNLKMIWIHNPYDCYPLMYIFSAAPVIPKIWMHALDLNEILKSPLNYNMDSKKISWWQKKLWQNKSSWKVTVFLKMKKKSVKTIPGSNFFFWTLVKLINGVLTYFFSLLQRKIEFFVPTNLIYMKGTHVLWKLK